MEVQIPSVKLETSSGSFHLMPLSDDLALLQSEERMFEAPLFVPAPLSVPSASVSVHVVTDREDGVLTAKVLLSVDCP